MRLPLLLLAVVAPLLAVGAGTAAETGASVLVVTYVEAPAKGVRTTGSSLQTYAERIRRVAAPPTIEVLREVGRANRLVVLERWSANGAVDLAGGELQKAVDDKIQGPLDRRAFRPLGPLLARTSVGPFHVVMHVDVVPDGSALGARLMTELRATVLAAPGGLGFEAGTQSDRANHFAVHEVWTSRAAYEAYGASPEGRNFRRQLSTVRGAPFDDRFYIQAR